MNIENVNIWFWIILLLYGVICAIIGYWIAKSKSSQTTDLSGTLKTLDAENNKLKSELDACKKKLDSEKSKDIPKASIAAPSKTEKQIVQKFDAAAAKDALGKKVKQDDLKIVEGIGPKIEGLFHNHGIKTWKALAEISTDKCQEVLSTGGDRYRLHDPASWPMQAKMAQKGQWKELRQWQDDHKAGKF